MSESSNSFSGLEERLSGRAILAPRKELRADIVNSVRAELAKTRAAVELRPMFALAILLVFGAGFMKTVGSARMLTNSSLPTIAQARIDPEQLRQFSDDDEQRRAMAGLLTVRSSTPLPMLPLVGGHLPGNERSGDLFSFAENP